MGECTQMHINAMEMGVQFNGRGRKHVHCIIRIIIIGVHTVDNRSVMDVGVVGARASELNRFTLRSLKDRCMTGAY